MSLNVGTGKARRVGPLCTGKWNVGTDYGIQLGPLREIRQTPGLGKVCRDDNTACLGRSLQCNRSTMLAGGTIGNPQAGPDSADQRARNPDPCVSILRAKLNSKAQESKLPNEPSASAFLFPT